MELLCCRQQQMVMHEPCILYMHHSDYNLYCSALLCSALETGNKGRIERERERVRELIYPLLGI